MAINTNFNVDPYYDDFDEDKKFLRMLFKPGFAVQARELTQLQTILQKQVDRFGRHVFTNGSVVSGCQYHIQDATSLNLNPSYATTDVTANNFIDKSILTNDDAKRAEVIKVYEADTGTDEPITLMVKQIRGEDLASSEEIRTDETSSEKANIATTGVNTGQTFSVSDGVFFYDGFFVKVTPQTIALNKYSNAANLIVGFEVTESTVKSSSDTSLLDPAQDASNYQAPGADRFKIDLILSTRALDSTDTEQFIELVRVDNGVITKDYKYPIYSVLADELARRTFDESGDYTVRPFKLALEDNTSNTSNLDVIVSTGKAYVKGYEIDKSEATTITVEKPRDTANVQNKRVSADYGNFVFTKSHYNTFPINAMLNVDIHCVANGSITTTSAATIANSKIGTARVRNLEYDSSSNTADTSTYEFRTFLFDVDTSSGITGKVNAVAADTTTVQIGQANTSELFSTVDNAYRGALLTITSGPGSDEAPKLITAHTGSTGNLTVESAYVTKPTGESNFSIDFDFKQAESLIVSSAASITAAVDIDERSKDSATTYSDAFLSESELEPLLFELGQNYVKNGTLADLTYTHKRLFPLQASDGTGDISISLTDSEESWASGSTETLKLQNYHVVCTTADSLGNYSIGEVVRASNLTVTGASTQSLTLNVSGTDSSFRANVIAAIDVSDATADSIRSKTAKIAGADSTILAVTQGGSAGTLTGTAPDANVDSGLALVYEDEGFTYIANTAVVKTPATEQSLYVHDVYELTAVYDYEGSDIAAATAGTDVTSRYELDTGQRDASYDWSSIKLKAGQTAPSGPLLVKYSRYKSSSAGKFFSVDSYPTYATIPNYSSDNGTVYSLRDVLDFRAVRDDASGSYTSTTETYQNGVTDGTKIPRNGSDIIVDYDYYLPRIDKVVLAKTGDFQVVKGNADLYPVEPNDLQDAMTLFTLKEQAYLANVANVEVEFSDTKRFTMRDIGAIEKRVQSLEYYQSLSLLEQDTLNKQDLTILDSSNLPRFKNGIITDDFTGHSIAEVSAVDYKASIDVTENELRPSFNITSVGLQFDSANSSNFEQRGPIVTIAQDSIDALIDQPKASKAINVNPFNVVAYLGHIELDPPSDVWIDVTRKADVVQNIGGSNDAWTEVLKAAGVYGTTVEWGSWKTRWAGEKTVVSRDRQATGRKRRQFPFLEAAVTTVSTQLLGQTRTGVRRSITTQTVTESLGDRVVDVSVIPYMRNIPVLFTGSGFKPDTILHSFFDSSNVTDRVARLNRIILANTALSFNTQTGNAETVDVIDISDDSVRANGISAKASNNSIFIANLNTGATSNTLNVASYSSGIKLVGQSSGESHIISGYEHWVGPVQSATSTTIVLREDAEGSNTAAWYANTTNASTIYIVSGTGAGQTRTVSNYAATTRTITVSSAWTTTPDTTSIYSFRPESTRAGDTAGIFFIPTGTFRTGEKRFRLIDNSTGDLGSSSTNGDASFFAQGLLQTKQEVKVSSVVPVVRRRGTVRDNRVTVDVTARRTTTWYDPLAQTFLISPSNYPQGLFIDKVRLCFKTKDESIPVTLQLRPAVNGFPSSSVIYPHSTVSLTPDKVNITDSPDLDDATKFTDFVFDSPVFLEPGEHSFVLLANSKKYETYVGEIGQLDLVSQKQISEQPYGGSLFISQNGSTWTPDQNSDMLFRMFKKVFSSSTASAKFIANDGPLSSNVVYDYALLTTNDNATTNTTLSYNIVTEKSGGGLTAAKNITPFEDNIFNDNSGRRVVNTNRGNTTIVLTGSMSTVNPEISPVIDINRSSLIAVENIINNLPLQNTGFTITNVGSGYTSAPTAAFSGGGGSGAAADVTVSGGEITGITLTNNGSGYTTSPTITLSGGGGTNGAITYNGEDKKQGGNALARYITRRVVLADGFESGDLRVYLTANKPGGANIHVYYKILSKSDNSRFEDKNYQLMTQIGNTGFVSANADDFRELTFAPGVNNTANNSVSYTSGTSTYNTFKTFAIKVVMTGTDTVDVPRIRDLRAIAMPRG